MENLEIYSKYKAVPENAKKKIGAGRLKGFTDINPMWRIKALTEQFGPCGKGWYYVPTRQEEKVCENGEILCFTDINLFVKYDGEWSAPIRGTGGSHLVSKEKNGFYYDDEGWKKAETDALGIACKNLGIGADVWWESDRTKYTAPQPATHKQASGQSNNTESVQKIDAVKARTLSETAKRKGFTENSIKKKYGIASFADMTFDQWNDAMKILDGKPDVKPASEQEQKPDVLTAEQVAFIREKAQALNIPEETILEKIPAKIRPQTLDGIPSRFYQNFVEWFKIKENK